MAFVPSSYTAAAHKLAFLFYCSGPKLLLIEDVKGRKAYPTAIESVQ